jgi:hypothetical protein
VKIIRALRERGKQALDGIEAAVRVPLHPGRALAEQDAAIVHPAPLKQ